MDVLLVRENTTESYKKTSPRFSGFAAYHITMENPFCLTLYIARPEYAILNTFNIHAHQQQQGYLRGLSIYDINLHAES